MKKTVLLLVLLALVACGRAPGPAERPAPAPGSIAIWAGGEVGLTEIESRYPNTLTPACRSVREGDASIELLIPCYREIAEEIVLEQAMLARIGGASAALVEADEPEIVRLAYFRAFQDLVQEQIEVSEEEITSLFEERRGDFRQPGSLSLWNIFRRHRDTHKPEESIAFLNEIRARAEAGETFQSLARQYSDSETRLRDGSVGRISEGDLPPRLEEVAFSLESGDVSEPIPVRGGAVLLQIRDPIPGIEFELDDVRRGLELEIRSTKLQEMIRERIALAALPDGSTVLGEEELAARITTGDDADLVFEVDDRRLTVAEFRKMAGLPESGDRAVDREHLIRIYQNLVESEQLFRDLRAADDPLAATVRMEATDLQQQAAVALLVNRALQRDVEAAVDGAPEALVQYFEDNEHHYQSPLRFRLRLWSQPFGTDPPAQLAVMEGARRTLLAGDKTLDELTAELGGEIEDLGWRHVDDLTELPHKARMLVLQSEPGGYTMAYQQDEALHLIEITERVEPNRLPYEAVVDEVREDYLLRFAQRLTREAIDNRLSEAGFEFFDERAERLLRTP